MQLLEQQARLLALGIPTEVSKYGDLTPLTCDEHKQLEAHGFVYKSSPDYTIATFETATERCNIIACHPPMIEIFPITPEEVTE
jgi:hypothetical protein